MAKAERSYAERVGILRAAAATLTGASPVWAAGPVAMPTARNLPNVAG
jgi:hypothetical protein